MKRNELKARAAQYTKVVEWSEEDSCFIGSAPPLVGPCCGAVGGLAGAAHAGGPDRQVPVAGGAVTEWVAPVEVPACAAPAR